jgi:hypothetical protein
MLAKLGAGDYCKDPRNRKLDFHLAHQQAGYCKGDKLEAKKPEISKLALVQIPQWASSGPRGAVLANLI